VRKEGDTFVVTAPGLRRIFARTEMTSPRQFSRQLARLGVTKALERAGVKPGDRVRCGNLEWEWQ
jgi:GTP-binding protein